MLVGWAPHSLLPDPTYLEVLRAEPLLAADPVAAHLLVQLLQEEAGLAQEHPGVGWGGSQEEGTPTGLLNLEAQQIYEDQRKKNVIFMCYFNGVFHYFFKADFVNCSLVQKSRRDFKL